MKVRAASLDAAFKEVLRPIKKMLTRIESRLERMGDLAGGKLALPSDDVDLVEKQGVANQRDVPVELVERVQDRFDQLTSEVQACRRAIAELSKSPGLPSTRRSYAAVEDASTLSPEDRLGLESIGWSSLAEVILGPDLYNEPTLLDTVHQFILDVVHGVAGARGLAGQLLLFHEADPKELPECLPHIGEAYYRWRQPAAGNDEPFERKLADWLTERASAVGLTNSIQLVAPGDRFDNTRHSASSRGVEVVAVHGWVVLRDHHNVYTRASVTVR